MSVASFMFVRMSVLVSVVKTLHYLRPERLCHSLVGEDLGLTVAVEAAEDLHDPVRRVELDVVTEINLDSEAATDAFGRRRLLGRFKHRIELGPEDLTFGRGVESLQSFCQLS